MLQQIPYLSNVFGSLGGIEPLSDKLIDDMFGPANWPNLGRYTLVNGLRIPTITMAPGEVRRLRLVHSGQREAILLRIEASASSSRPGNPLPVVSRDRARRPADGGDRREGRRRAAPGLSI